MKKTVLILTLLCLLLLSGCQRVREMVIDSASSDQEAAATPIVEFEEDINSGTGEEMPEPEESTLPTENAFDNMRTLSLQNGVLNMEIPVEFTESYDFPSAMLFTSDYLTGADGEQTYCQMTAVHFFQKEEPLMDYDMFNEYIEFMPVMDTNINSTYERIMELTFNNGANGFITKYDIVRDADSYDGYALFVASDGVYYEFLFFCGKDYFSDEDIIKMFKSLEIDTDKEQAWVDNFEVNIKNRWYSSAFVEGAKIDLGELLGFTESIRFSYFDSILSATLDSNMGSINIAMYPQDIYGFNSYEEFMQYALSDVMDRGLFISDLPDRDIYQDITDTGQLFFAYLNNENFYVVHYAYEYEDAYYLAEIFYMGEDMDELQALMDCAESFTAPGENTTPVFTEEDNDWADGNPYEE